MNVPTGQCCPPSIGMVAAFKLESLAGIVGIRTRLSRAYAVVGRETPSGEFSGRLSSFAPSWTDCASITAGRFRADAINASETDCLAGHVGFEPANPSASYLIGILKRDF